MWWGTPPPSTAPAPLKELQCPSIQGSFRHCRQSASNTLPAASSFGRNCRKDPFCCTSLDSLRILVQTPAAIPPIPKVFRPQFFKMARKFFVGGNWKM